MFQSVANLSYYLLLQKTALGIALKRVYSPVFYEDICNHLGTITKNWLEV